MKKFLLVAACFALTLSSCIKDETSASVDRIYDAYAQKLSAEAALTQAEAEALKLLSEADAALKAAEAEAMKIMNQILDIKRQLAEVHLEYAKAELELKLAELEAKLVELQATMEKAAVEAEKALLDAMAELNQAQVDFITSVESLEAAEAARLVGLFNAYTEAVEKLIEAKTAVTTKTAELAAVENNLVDAEEYRDDAIAEIEEEIAYYQHEIAMAEKAIEIFTKYQTVTVEEAEAALELALVDLSDLSIAATLAAKASREADEKFAVEYDNVVFDHEFYTTLNSNPLGFDEWDDVKVIDGVKWYGFYTKSEDPLATENTFTPVYTSFEPQYDYDTDEEIYYPFFAEESGKIEYTTSASLLPATVEYEVLDNLGHYSKEGLEAYIAYMESLAAEYPGYSAENVYELNDELTDLMERYYEAMEEGNEYMMDYLYSQIDEVSYEMNMKTEYIYYLYAVKVLPELEAALPLFKNYYEKTLAWKAADEVLAALVADTTLPEVDEESGNGGGMGPQLPDVLEPTSAEKVAELEKEINGYDAVDPWFGEVYHVDGLKDVAAAAKKAYEEAGEVTKDADETQKAAKKDLDDAKAALAAAPATATEAEKKALKDKVEAAQKAYDKAVAAYNDAVQKETWAKEDQAIADANLLAAEAELKAAKEHLAAQIAKIPAAEEAIELAQRDAIYYFAQNEAVFTKFSSITLDELSYENGSSAANSAQYAYLGTAEEIETQKEIIAEFEAGAADYMNAAENIKVAEQLIKDLEILEADAVKFVEEYNAASKAAAEACVAYAIADDAYMLKQVEVLALNTTLSDAELIADAIESYNEDIEIYNDEIKELEAEKVEAANLATYEDAVEFAKMRLEAAEAAVEFYTARAEAAEAAWKDAE